MRPTRRWAALILAMGLVATVPCAGQSTWEGVDKTVVAKVAADAGRPPREPYFNTDRGDLLLFLFLVAGAAGGFVAGYTFRGLFPPHRDGQERHAPSR